MRVITVHQPWAWAIAHAGKDVENRTRSFGYRGPLAIHAGRTWEPSGAASVPLRAALHRAGGGAEPDPLDPRYATGVVVAVTELVDVHRGDGCCPPWGHALPLGASSGPRPARPVYHLVLRRVRALPVPVPCRGRQGLWRLPPPVAAAVAAA